MNKWLVAIIIVGLVGFGWYYARNQEFTPPWKQPKTGAVTRGDIRVPISAAGLIHANQVIDIKSKASGEVIEIPVVEGTFVTKGEVLLVLKKDDEQRTLDQREADLDRAEAALESARVALERADVTIAQSEQQLEESAANAEMSAFELQKVESRVRGNGSELYSAQQITNTRAQHRMNLARKEQSRISIESSKLAKRDAQANVLSNEATVRGAKKAVEDAEERLNETTIYAPQDAIVTTVAVREGMLVQSAIQTFTGGTSLMNLADVSRKKVIARLDEADYGRVLDVSPVDALPDMPGLREAARQDAETLQARGGMVRITVDAFPDRKFEGRIERVEPQGKLPPGASIIQFDVHVLISDPDAHMLPLGAQAQVEFTVESCTDAMRVPAEAVKNHEEQRGVWVKAKGAGGASGEERWPKRFVPCRFGISDGEFTQVLEVLNGELKEGDEVYTKLPPADGEES